MCGRFTLSTDLAHLQLAFQIDQIKAEPTPSFNVAPTHAVSVLVQRQGSNTLEMMHWGLIPVWAKDPQIGSKMINARVETVAEKPSFKRLLKNQRCLILADGFYEWREDSGKKSPMFIRLRSQEPFGFAGLFDMWKSPEGETVTSCTIITTAANELMRPFHHRMPIILPKSVHAKWLDPALQDSADLLPLLQPYPAEEMEAYPVSTRVNSPSHNSPECIEPVVG